MSTALLNLLNVCAIIIALSLFGIREHSVSFSNIFKHSFCLFDLFLRFRVVFIRMPFYSFLAVSFLDCSFIAILWYVQDFIIIFTFALLQFQLGFLDLLSKTNRLWSEFFDFRVLGYCFLILFFVKQNITLFQVSLGILLVHFYCNVQIFHSFVSLSNFLKRTCPVVKDSLVKLAIKVIELQTLPVEFNCFFPHIRSCQFVRLIFKFFTILQAFPILDVGLVIGINVQSLFQVFFAHVKLTIVNQDACAPEEEVCVVNKLLLH